MNIQSMRKKAELLKVKAAKADIEIHIFEKTAEIERLKKAIEIQDAKIEEIKKELENYEGVTNV